MTQQEPQEKEPQPAPPFFKDEARGWWLVGRAHAEWGQFDHDPVGGRWLADRSNEGHVWQVSRRGKEYWDELLVRLAEKQAEEAAARFTPEQRVEYDEITALRKEIGQLRSRLERRGKRRHKLPPEPSYTDTIKAGALNGLAEGRTPEQIKPTLPTLLTFSRNWLAELTKLWEHFQLPPSVRARLTKQANNAAHKASKLAREAKGIRAGAPRRAECQRAGHDLTDPANVYVRADGRRMCAQCAKERNALAFKQRKQRRTRRKR